MANTPSALKRARQNEKRRARNRAHRSRMRSAIKDLRAAVDAGDRDTACTLLPQTVSVINAIAGKGVIHKNAAARTTSRLTRAVARLDAS